VRPEPLRQRKAASRARTKGGPTPDQLPRSFLRWLARQPALIGFLDRLERDLAAGRVSWIDISRLAKRWTEGLPPARGKVLSLRDFAQQRLDLGIAEAKRRTRRTRRAVRGRARR
jgi:hypothetical protein